MQSRTRRYLHVSFEVVHWWYCGCSMKLIAVPGLRTGVTIGVTMEAVVSSPGDMYPGNDPGKLLHSCL